MGFLEHEVDATAYRLGAAVKRHFCAMRDTFYGLPFWKVFPTRPYRQFVESEEEIYE
jgi:ecdysone 20-monooxygenase